jgi:hypothetical protein
MMKITMKQITKKEWAVYVSGVPNSPPDKKRVCTLRDFSHIDILCSYRQFPEEVHAHGIALLIAAKFASVAYEFSPEQARVSVTALAKYHGAEVEFEE